MTMHRVVSALALAVFASVPSFAAGQQVNGDARLAQRDDLPRRQAAAAAGSEVRRSDQGRRSAIETVVGAARRAADGCAQCAPDHHRRRRLRRAEHVRRCDSDAVDGPDRDGRAALQPCVLHGALLADARRADHGAQSSLRRLRRDLGAVDRLSRLQQHHRERQGDDRAHPARQRIRDLLVRQEPQYAGVCREPGRSVRPVAHRDGVRVLLRLRRRRRQPVGAQPLPQHDADLSVLGQGAGHVEPGHRDGRRRDRLHDAHAPDRPVEAYLHQVRAGSDARAASPAQGVGGQDQRHAPVRRRLREVAGAHLREPEASRRHPEGHEARAVAEGHIEAVGPALGRREEALHPPGRGLCRVCRLQRLRDRARDPALPGSGPPRQHARHLHQRRQRNQRRGGPGRYAERGRILQRPERAAHRRADEVLRRLGHRADLQPHVGRLVVGVRHAVRLVQADRLPPRRRADGTSPTSRRAGRRSSAVGSPSSARRR